MEGTNSGGLSENQPYIMAPMAFSIGTSML